MYKGGVILDWIEIGQKLHKARINKGISQEKLAEQVGVTPASISYYESGKKRPSFEKIKKICEVLNLNMDEL